MKRVIIMLIIIFCCPFKVVGSAKPEVCLSINSSSSVYWSDFSYKLNAAVIWSDCINTDSLSGELTIDAISDTSIVIKRIRKQFLLINSKTSSYKRKNKEISGSSAEGGHLTGYYDKGFLVRLTSAFYGETGKIETDYYFDQSGLFFQYKNEIFYDKPSYIQGFGIQKIEENRLYFDENQIIKWISAITIKPGTSITLTKTKTRLIKSENFGVENVTIQKEVKKLRGILN